MATTDLSGYVDPNYRDNFQTKRIALVGSGMPLDEQKALEETFITALEKYDVEVLRGLDLYPPTRNIEPKNMLKIARKNGADTMLLITSAGRDVTESYIPPTYHPGTSTSHVTGYGSYATVHTHTTPGYTTGGYSVSMPGMGVAASLINAKNRETVWTASGFSGGNEFASFKDLTVSVARETVLELAKVGLIAKKESNDDEEALEQQ